MPAIRLASRAMARLTTEGGGLCAVCEGGRAQPRVDLGDYRLYHCARCGCWTSDADFRGAAVSFEPQAYFAHPDADRPRWEDLHARRERAGLPLRSVLDVGCGNGAYLAWLRAHAPEARRHGIELDPGRSAEARAADPEATIHEGDALACLDALGDGFDLVTLWDVFEHVHAPGRLLDALASKLAPGGWIFLQTIHEHSAVPAVGRWLHALSGGRLTGPVRRTHDAHHLSFFTLDALDALVEKAGLATRERWWGRLARDRMDGPAWLTAATAAVLRVENALGNGLFVNLLLEPAPPSAAGSSPAPARAPDRAAG